jgi:hypothetical protein
LLGDGRRRRNDDHRPHRVTDERHDQPGDVFGDIVVNVNHP